MTHQIDQLLEHARAANIMISTAESCTGGMISAAITAIPGSSDVFDRGFVTYSNAAKQDMLGVKSDTLNAHGAVSEQTAREMALGALHHSKADIAVSVTGVAGPGASEHKPEGRVCFGLATSSHHHVETVEFGAIGRDNVRKKTTHHALNLLLSAIKAAS